MPQNNRWKLAMRRFSVACSLWIFLSCAVATAQQPAATKQQPLGTQQPLVTKIDRPPVTGLQAPAPPPPTHFTPTTLSAPAVTPELWVYSQEQRRHDDPAQAVRRKAEFQAEQRMARLASLKWYGYSNSRPEAGMTPIMGTYSAGWGGNGWNRYEWFGVGGVWW
jgi:hypothetical protein